MGLLEATELACGSPWCSAWHAAGLGEGQPAVPGQRKVSPEEEVEMKLPRAEGPPSSWVTQEEGPEW